MDRSSEIGGYMITMAAKDSVTSVGQDLGRPHSCWIRLLSRGLLALLMGSIFGLIVSGLWLTSGWV